MFKRLRNWWEGRWVKFNYDPDLFIIPDGYWHRPWPARALAALWVWVKRSGWNLTFLIVGVLTLAATVAALLKPS